MATSTNAPSALTQLAENLGFSEYWKSHGHVAHLVIIAAIVVVVHLVVKIVRHISEWTIKRSQAQRNPLGFVTHQPKFITVIRLIVSTITFSIYFVAIGLVLTEAFKLDLGTYLASATIVGLAVSFGSQSLVQDVVTGVTLIFSDTMDVGDIVDFGGGTVGRVDQIGLRFTTLTNFFNQVVFVPNRNITNVSRFPHGGVYAYADIQIPARADPGKAAETIANVARGTWMQFNAIVLNEPVLGKVEVAEKGGWNFLRVQFKVWPGQGTLIETTFRQQMVNAMKVFDPNYAEWMVVVTYRAITGTRA